MPGGQVSVAGEAQSVKRRAACDECRSKKLKCSGEQPACARCVREKIACVYSAQKQMGRPKKRQRREEDERETQKSTDATRAPNSNTEHGGWNVNSASTAGFAFDTTTWDSSLLPNWSFHQSRNTNDWEYYSPSSIPAENALPGLTPDSSSNSPPTLNLPPELQNITHMHDTQHHHPTPNHETSTQLLLDPSLTNPTTATTTDPTHPNPSTASPSLPACACLPTLYLTLNTLQTMDPTFPFPYALHPLREAMSTAATVLQCPQCPTRFISAVQNTQLVGTLLVSIADRFAKVLTALTTECARAEHANERKKFRLADLNTSTVHLHTGGLGCAAAFSIDLAPAEWRSMAKKVVRAEVYGPSDGNDCCSHFMGLTQMMEERQNWFHMQEVPEDFPRDPRTGLKMGGANLPKEEHLCLKMVGYARKLVEGFDWS